VPSIAETILTAKHVRHATHGKVFSANRQEPFPLLEINRVGLPGNYGEYRLGVLRNTRVHEFPSPTGSFFCRFLHGVSRSPDRARSPAKVFGRPEEGALRPGPVT